MSPWQKVRAARRREAYFISLSFRLFFFLISLSFRVFFFPHAYCVTDSVAETTGFMGFVLFLFPFGFFFRATLL
jgi:hypothetical protein